MSSTFVILDSSALIAQLSVKALWHQKANMRSEFIEHTDRKVILPAEVLAETLNRIGNNIGRQDAVLAGTALLERNNTGDILITHSNTDILISAGSFFGYLPLFCAIPLTLYIHSYPQAPSTAFSPPFGESLSDPDHSVGHFRPPTVQSGTQKCLYPMFFKHFNFNQKAIGWPTP
jgi:hypothetical protein